MSSAQDTTPEIRVTGEATVSVEPDQAEVDFGVVTQAPTAKAAADANATKLDEVVTSLRARLGSNGKLETIGYAIRPNYHRPRGGGEATIASYTATNTVRTTGVPIDGTGELIDAATEAGANNVERLVFTVENADAPRLQALRDAATRARAKADALADALDLEIVRILSVEEGVAARPVYAARSTMQAEMAAAAPTTPVEPGAVDFRATVTLRVLVSPR